MKFITMTLSFVFCWSVLFSQVDTIRLDNASFEGTPMESGYNSMLPSGWENCGPMGETAPDVHPVVDGQFMVITLPQNGKTYIGMVTRDNDTWERMGTKLSSALEKGRCYEFSIFLARSEFYLSYSQTRNTEANYAQPVKFRIWGGTDKCDRAELLGATVLIKNTTWLKYSFVLQPQEGNYDYLVFEAFYNTPTLVPYNGNLLMDNASVIISVNCDLEQVSEAVPELSEEEKTEQKIRYEVRAETMEDFRKLEAFTKFSGKYIGFNEQTTDLRSIDFEIAEENYTETSGLNKIFELTKGNPRLAILIGVKKNGGKKIQAARIEKIKAMATAAGLDDETVLVRKANKINWSYPWDAENKNLVFYVFKPEE